MKFALIGDIHGYWNHLDIEYFNASDYDCLFFTGDLRGNPKLGKLSFQGLTKRAYMIPGNWDGTSLTSIIGEVIQSKILIHSGQFGQNRRMRKLSELVKPISLLGYSSLVLSSELDLSLIVGRPHAMGGGLSFAPNMAKAYLVSNMEASIEKYKRLIDGTKEKIYFFFRITDLLVWVPPKTPYLERNLKKMVGIGGISILQKPSNMLSPSGKKFLWYFQDICTIQLAKRKNGKLMNTRVGPFM